MLTNFLDPKLLEFIRKNKLVFSLVVLLGGNICQYVQRVQLEQQTEQEIKDLNQKIQDRDQSSLEYERNRSEKLEFLLSNLAKSSGDDKSH